MDSLHTFKEFERYLRSDSGTAYENHCRGFLLGWLICMCRMYTWALDDADSAECFYTARYYWNLIWDRIGNEGFDPLDIGPDFFVERPYKDIRKEEGFIYILRADNELFKIGQTINLSNRIKQLGIQLPYQLELVCVVGTDHVSIAEQLIHDRYAEKRVRGEWFRLIDEDIAELKALGYIYAAAGKKVAMEYAGWKELGSGEE